MKENLTKSEASMNQSAEAERKPWVTPRLRDLKINPGTMDSGYSVEDGMSGGGTMGPHQSG
jgi:hypothetical protein